MVSIAAVILAKHAGFCFGVRRAVETAQASAPAITLGPIIHNPQVVASLAEMGVMSASSPEDIPVGQRAVIRSHGVDKKTFEALDSRGLTVVDATCPFVKKIHRIVEEQSIQGRRIIVIGDAKHPEVMGIIGWCKNDAVVLDTIEEAEKICLFEGEKVEKEDPDLRSRHLCAGQSFPLRYAGFVSGESDLRRTVPV